MKSKLIFLPLFALLFGCQALSRNTSTAQNPSGAEGQPHGINLALGKPVSASASSAMFPPDMAVDGITDLQGENYWSPGGEDPQWIEIDFVNSITIENIFLLPELKDGIGGISLRISGCDQSGQGELLEENFAELRSGEWFSISPSQPWAGIRCVKIESSQSAAWFGWREIEITGSVEDEEVIAATEIVPPMIPSVIFHNGDVLTIVEDMPSYEAIAIRGNEILAVGTNEEILGLRAPTTELVDLGGHTLMPGFIEAHSHMLHFAPGGDLGREEAIQIALSYGLTTINELVVDEDDLAWLQTAEEAGELPIRVNAFPLYNDLGLDSAGNTIIRRVWFPENGPVLDLDRRLRIPGIKIYVDGSFVPGRGCPALSEPYPLNFAATPEFQRICYAPDGDLYLSQEELNLVVAEAQGIGFRVAFHVMGDRGADTALNAIENALAGASNLLFRHSIHHNSLLRPDQIDRYAELDILASVRGYFNTCDQNEYPYYYGPDRYQWTGNRYSLAARGIHAFSEGDYLWRFPPEDRLNSTQLNPLVNLFGLVTRKQFCADGSIAEPAEWLHPDSIRVADALRMLTFEPAFLLSQETVIGTLEAGKFADLIILSRNPLSIPPDELIDLEVWMTMVGGIVEYCASDHHDLCP